MSYLEDVIGEVYAEIARRVDSDQPPGLTTGLAELDDIIGGGWVRQQLSYLVADSGIGKSWLAMSWVLKAAKWIAENQGSRPASGYVTSNDQDDTQTMVKDKEGKPPVIVFWSLEMSEAPLVVRMMSQLAHEEGLPVDSGKLLRGNFEGGLTEEMSRVFGRVYHLLHDVYGRTVYLEFAARSISQFREVLDALVQAQDVCLVVVDYFRLIDEVSMDGNMTTIQAERSKKLKEIAKEYDCHVLSIFDINREGQKAGKPQTYHMRGGVAAHYDADLVLTLETEEEEHAHLPANIQPSERHLVFRVAKGRHVAQARLDLSLNLATGLVELWDKRSSVPKQERREYAEQSL